MPSQAKPLLCCLLIMVNAAWPESTVTVAVRTFIWSSIGASPTAPTSIYFCNGRKLHGQNSVSSQSIWAVGRIEDRLGATRKRIRPLQFTMDVCANAPLASLEIDYLSDDSYSVVGSCIQSQRHISGSLRASTPDPMDFDSLLGGSLSDLVVNFEEKIVKSLSPSISRVRRNEIREDDATLSQVKFWWREVATEQPPMEYPLGEGPSKLSAYEEFEDVDVDGITEDGVLVGDEAKEAEDTFPSGPDSGESDRETVTTHSPSITPSSTAPDLDELVHVPPEGGQGDLCKTPSTRRPSLEFELSAFKSVHPKPRSSDTKWVQDLDGLSTRLLKLYIEELSQDVMHLSDLLVESLAARDELTMLREASDDFIILLNLVQQRRSRASRAALLATARARLRPKGFVRLRSTWLGKTLLGGSTLSITSLHDVTEEAHLKGSSVLHCNGTTDAVTTQSTKPADSVDLNLSSGAAAYYKSLNLQSKQRRPRFQPIVPNGCNGTIDSHVRHGPEIAGNVEHPLDKVGVFANGSAPNGHPPNGIKRSLAPPVDLPAARFQALTRLSVSTPWPEGRPQRSQSLNLHLPYTIDSRAGVTLSNLRVINQILYSTLLEGSATERLVDTYIHALSADGTVNGWLNKNAGHLIAGTDRPCTLVEVGPTQS
ncbi:unnamed protein product [Calicophoron daubneyi]|uniref:Uncharacterized protein n=1 Tax=Calicophoron daubneyi TaxID=300641 RepID=A0AAV2T610_CALDB